MTKPLCPAKAVLRKFNGAGPADGGQAGAGARAGTADGVGAQVGARPLVSDMDMDTPVGATEAGVMAAVAVVAVAAMASAAAGKLNLTW